MRKRRWDWDCDILFVVRPFVCEGGGEVDGDGESAVRGDGDVDVEDGAVSKWIELSCSNGWTWRNKR